MLFTTKEITETLDMFMRHNLDIRCITLGISLLDCVSENGKASRERIKEKILRTAGKLSQTGRDIENEFGIPIINKRVAVTPIA
ncbi:MAG: DUF711 family protein, partial [Spirochaetaceae bacterium]|nr:DUF711 family protein [Spirochaetaceae bacterium]